MRTSFTGLEIGRRSLLAYQKALEVTGHNIANANNKAYSRQEVNFQATDPYAIPTMQKGTEAGMIGTGVTVTDVRAVRDEFLNAQARNSLKALGYWQTHREVLQEVELFFNEPGETGISTALTEFWTAWEEVAADPGTPAVRWTLVERAEALAAAIRQVYGQLGELKLTIDESIRHKINQANGLGQRIAQLNSLVVKIEATGDNANDLIDSRNQLVEELSRMMDLNIRYDRYNQAQIVVNGTIFVAGDIVNRIDIVDVPLAQPVWNHSGGAVLLRQGELGALLEARDNSVQSYLDSLVRLAEDLVAGVNALHRTGYDQDGIQGGDFFEMRGGPESLRVVADVRDNPRRIAAALEPGKAGDGRVATEIARLRNQSGRFDSRLRSVISQLGIESQSAGRLAGNQEFLLKQVENQRMAATGVSLDEEMTKLIQYQHGYSAAARIVSAVDEMIDTVINRMGLVGR